MAFAVAGLFAEGETTIQNVECVATSYPGFEHTLRQFQSKAITNLDHTHVISALPMDPDAKKKKPANPPSQFPI
jgi:3-phosphoshikimate 1-carboxyvinyltransferase